MTVYTSNRKRIPSSWTKVEEYELASSNLVEDPLSALQKLISDVKNKHPNVNWILGIVSSPKGAKWEVTGVPYRLKKKVG